MREPKPLCSGLLLLMVALLASSGMTEPLPPIRLVDGHTAGTLPKGVYEVENRIFPSGTYENGCGLLFDIAVGITDKFTIGLGYGGDGIVGRGRDVRMNPFPGCLVKYRLFDENFFLPGLAVGFDYQGYGGIARKDSFGYDGYIYKSQGFFAAFSKSYLLLKKLQFGLHGDVNLSMEDIENASWPNAMVGFDLGVTERFSFLIEYDLGINTKDPRDSDKTFFRPQDGYLHAGFRWRLSDNFIFEIDGRDLIEKRMRGVGETAGTIGWGREVKLIYRSQI